MWEVFKTDQFDLWLCAPVSSYGHVGKLPRPILALNYRLQVKQVNVEEIGDDPFTVALHSHCSFGQIIHYWCFWVVSDSCTEVK